MKNLKTIKKHPVYFFLIFCFLIVSVTGCKTKKEVRGSMKSYEAQELFNLVISNRLDYQTFSGKMKSTLRLGKNNVTVNANLRMVKDEKLQLSFQAPLLGELFRISVSKDSLLIIDRMNKQYAYESIQDIKRSSSFDFNLYNLQALFTNQIFLMGKPDISQTDYQYFVFEQEKDQMLIKTKEKSINYTFSVDYTDHIRNSLLTGNSGKVTMNWSYNDFSPLENRQLFPMQMAMNLISSTNKLSLNFVFSQIYLNKNVEIELDIPRKYDRITLAQAMILINKMQS